MTLGRELAGSDEAGRPGRRQPVVDLGEHGVEELLVAHALDVTHVLGVDVVNQAAGQALVQALDEVPAPLVATDEQDLDEDPAVAETANHLFGSGRVVGRTVGDDDDVGRHGRLARLGVALVATAEEATTPRDDVAVAGLLGHGLEGLGEASGATGADALALQVVVEVVQLDLPPEQVVVEEERRHRAVVIHDHRERQHAVDDLLDGAVAVLVRHRSGTVDDADDGPHLVGVDLGPEHRLRGAVDLAGHQAAGALLLVGLGHQPLGARQVCHYVLLCSAATRCNGIDA